MSDLLDPDRAAEVGAPIGQQASRLADGGLLLSTARLIEMGARATIVIAPGLFRWDLTPLEETLGIQPRTLGPFNAHWRAQESTWDGYREAGKIEPVEFTGMLDIPGRPLSAWVHILSFTDRDAGCVHFVSKAEIRELRQ